MVARTYRCPVSPLQLCFPRVAVRPSDQHDSLTQLLHLLPLNPFRLLVLRRDGEEESSVVKQESVLDLSKAFDRQGRVVEELRVEVGQV